MGTRSTTHIYDGEISDENHLVSIYKQYDSYLSGYGNDLVEYILSMTIVNGYYSTQENGGYANGMGCLAAQLIKHFKEKIGGYYITSKTDIQEYNYYIYTVLDDVYIKVTDWDEKQIFNGTAQQLKLYIESENN